MLRYMFIIVIAFAVFHHVSATPVPSVIINEVMSSNGFTVADEDGDFEDWIELYNFGTEPVSMEGWGLSDKTNNPYLWVFPQVTIGAGEFLIVWASKKDKTNPNDPLHTNFGISTDGDALFLHDADADKIDEMPETAITSDISYGRKTNDFQNWFFFDKPTPGVANDSPAYLGITTNKPQLTIQPGFYAANVKVGLTNTATGVEYRYTLDGSVPTLASSLFEAEIEMTDRAGDPNILSMIPTAENTSWNGGPQTVVKKLNILRVCAFEEDYIPGEVVTASYLIDTQANERYQLPVVSIVSEYDSFFHPDTGLLVPTNYNNRGEEWERPAHIEWFEDGSLGFEQNIGIRIHGGVTRAARLKSLRLYARSRYGKKAIEYPIFPGRENNCHERLLLRSGGNSWNGVQFRDAFSQSLIAEATAVGHQDYRPVILFLNGEFWGIVNARDRIDEEFLANHYSVDEKRVDLLENYVAEKGSDEAYRALLNFFKTQDLDLLENYQWVAERVDIADFRDYHIAQSYIMNIDQPHNNAYNWRTQYTDLENTYADGRWRWILYDTDLGFNAEYFAGYYVNPFVFNTSLNHIDAVGLNPFVWPNSSSPEATMPLRQMLRSRYFREDFICRFADLLNTAFAPNYLIARLGAFQAEVYPHIAEHIARWGAPSSEADWENLVIDMYKFAWYRADYVRSYMRDFFRLGPEKKLILMPYAPQTGWFRLNTVDIKPGTLGLSSAPFPWSGKYFKNQPMTVTAVPQPGYRFKEWKGLDTDAPCISFAMSKNYALEAIFEPVSAAGLLHYWSFNNQNNEPFYTIGGAALAVQPGSETEEEYSTKQEFSAENARLGEKAGNHLRLNNPLGAHINLTVPTAGYENLVLKYEARRSGQGAGKHYIAYTTDGSNYTRKAVFLLDNAAPKVFTVDFSDNPEVFNQPGFAIRMGFLTTAAGGGTEGNVRFDNISLEGVPSARSAYFTALELPHGQSAAEVYAYVNDRRGTVTVEYPATATISLQALAGPYAGLLTDWWCIVMPDSGANWYFYDGAAGWQAFPAGMENLAWCRPAYQGPFMDISTPIAILPATALPAGKYTIYFGIDAMDYAVNYPNTLFDIATLNVLPSSLPAEEPEVKIYANGQSTGVTVLYPDKVALTVTTKAGGLLNMPADWWCIAVPASGAQWYCYGAQGWAAFPAGVNNLALCAPALQTSFVDILVPLEILPPTILPIGEYQIYFGIDAQDGVLNYPEMLLDTVTVNVVDE